MRRCLHILVPLLAVALAGAEQPGGTIARIAGCGTCALTPDGSPALTSRLVQPTQIAVSADSSAVYFVEQLWGLSTPGKPLAGRVRKLTADAKVVAFAGTGERGSSGDGGPALNAALDPFGVAVDTATGSVYISDRGNSAIRKVTPDGVIHTLTTAVQTPEALAIDKSGNLYVCSGGQVFKVTPGGAATAFAGVENGRGFGGDRGPATLALLSSPNAIAVDAAGNVYISDSGNGRVRKVTTDGIITTVAGNGVNSFSDPSKFDGGPATAAPLDSPDAIAVDSAGNLYIAEWQIHVRKVTPAGIISTVVGRDAHEYDEREAAQFCCTGLLATAAKVEFPAGLAMDASNNLYIVDTANENLILKVAAESYSGTAAAQPKATAVLNAADYSAAVSPTAWITVMGTDLAPVTRSWTDADFVQGALPEQLSGVRVYVDGWPTKVSYISPTQINALVFHLWDYSQPWFLEDPVQVEILTPQGRSAPMWAHQSRCAPAVFRWPVDQGKWAIVQAYSDGAFIAPAGIIPGVYTRPARALDILTAYGTGFGPTNPPTPAGTQVTTPAPLRDDAALITEFVSVKPVWSGLIGPGLYQFNFVVPPGIPAGEYKFQPSACQGMRGSEAWIAFQQ